MARHLFVSDDAVVGNPCNGPLRFGEERSSSAEKKKVSALDRGFSGTISDERVGDRVQGDHRLGKRRDSNFAACRQERKIATCVKFQS